MHICTITTEKKITNISPLLILRLLATCSADKTVKIWSTEEDFKLVLTLTGHQRWVWDCAFSADSAYLVTGIKKKKKKEDIFVLR